MYNTSPIKSTVKTFTFSDNSKLKVTRESQKGSVTKWFYTRFEANAVTGNTTKKEGNDWSWKDAEDTAKKYAAMVGGEYSKK